MLRAPRIPGMVAEEESEEQSAVPEGVGRLQLWPEEKEHRLPPSGATKRPLPTEAATREQRERWSEWHQSLEEWRASPVGELSEMEVPNLGGGNLGFKSFISDPQHFTLRHNELQIFDRTKCHPPDPGKLQTHPQTLTNPKICITQPRIINTDP